MPTSKKTSVLFKYERAVLSTAEGEVVSDMLSDLEQLAPRGVNGAAFRAVYGTDKEVDVRKLQAQVAELDWAASPLILAPTTSGNVGLDARIRSASQVVEDINAKALADEAFHRKYLFFPIGTVDGNEALEEQVIAWMQRGGHGFIMTDMIKEVYGGAVTAIGTHDLDNFNAIARRAADLGVTIDGVDFSQLPKLSGSGKGGTDFSLNISYSADVSDGGASAFAGNVDTLRRYAQRPGGQNYELTTDAAIVQGVAFATGARLKTIPGIVAQHAQEQKPDAYAVLRVFRGFAPNSPDPFGDTRKASLGPDGHPSFDILFQTNRFLLEQINEQDMERTALMETFGDPYLYLFGSRARVWSYGGTLFDTKGLDWLNEWRAAYQKWVKGSASTKLKARAMLVYEDVAREGVIVTSNIGKSAQAPGMATLAFQMFVIKEHYIEGIPKSLQDGIPKKDEPTFLFSSTGKQQNIDEKYDVGYADVTPPVDASGTHAVITPSGSSSLTSPLAIEDRIARMEQDRIEQAIRANAFENERLVRPSGSFTLNLSGDSKRVLHGAAQAVAKKIKGMQSIAPMPNGSPVPLPLPVQFGVK